MWATFFHCEVVFVFHTVQPVQKTIPGRSLFQTSISAFDTLKRLPFLKPYFLIPLSSPFVQFDLFEKIMNKRIMQHSTKSNFLL